MDRVGGTRNYGQSMPEPVGPRNRQLVLSSLVTLLLAECGVEPSEEARCGGGGGGGGARAC